MVFYSIKSNEKVFHLPHCSVRRRIDKQNERHFDSIEIARAVGYRMCNCCSTVAVRLRKEQAEVNAFCQTMGIACYVEDGELHIRTPRSKWRIIANGTPKKLFLYHKNSFDREEKIPSMVPGYHSQAVRKKTIMGYLRYIVSHEDYWDNERKKARERGRMQKQKVNNLRRNTRKYQRGHGNMHVSANQLYSIMDSLY